MVRKNLYDVTEMAEMTSNKQHAADDTIARQADKIESMEQSAKTDRETGARDMAQVVDHSAAMGDEVAALRAAILEHKASSWRSHGHPRPCDLKLYGVLD